jgi:hypothetical protein
LGLPPKDNVREQLERMQAIAEKLDAMYRLASAEAAQLRAECGAQEDDRQHLIRCGWQAGWRSCMQGGGMAFEEQQALPFLLGRYSARGE